VRPEGGGWSAPCAVGRGGPVADKREGDGGTAIGRFRLRGLYFRPVRAALRLAALAIETE